MTTENELRQALAAEAETMKWSLTMHDVVAGELVDNVVMLDPVRRRRTPLVLGAAAAVVGLIGGGSYLATHRSSNEGRVLAGGRAAGKIAAPSAAASAAPGAWSAAPVPSGPVSLTGMTLVLPKDLPKNYRLQNVSAMPVGSNNGIPPGYSSHLLILKGATAAEQITVNASKFGNGAAVATTAPGTGQVVKVHGVDTQVFNAGEAKILSWSERDVQYQVSAAAQMSESEILKLAESIVPNEGSVTFTLPVPAGYTVSYDGDGNLQPPWSYNLQYSRENLDKPYDDNIGLDVRPSANAQLDELQMQGGFPGATSKKIKIGALDATLTVTNEGVPGPNGSAPSFISTMLMWKTADGLIINMNSQGLSEAELITLAESITTVDEATFRAAVGDRLQSNNYLPGPDFTTPGVITFTGTTDGKAWTAKVMPPGASDAPNANCAQFSLDGSGGSGMICAAGPTDDSLTQLSASGGVDGFTLAYGVVTDKIRKVVVRDADTKKDIVSVDTVAGTGGDDRRAWVIAMKPLAKDVKNFMLVALDEKGAIVGTPTPKPADQYPGNFGDPSMPGVQPTMAPPATAYVPGAPPAPDANDPAKLPVFASGTLDGRPWELRKPDGSPSTTLPGWSASGAPTCWFFSFAAGIPQMVCGGATDPKMNLVVAHDRRIFVLANTAPDVARVKATLKDGRVIEAVPTVKGSDRVAVIGLGLDDVLVSVTAVDANGKETTTVTGTLPGDPSLPFNFGVDNGSGGGFGGVAVATTAAAVPVAVSGAVPVPEPVVVPAPAPATTVKA